MPAQLENWFLRKPMQKMAPLLLEQSLNFGSRNLEKLWQPLSQMKRALPQAETSQSRLIKMER